MALHGTLGDLGMSDFFQLVGQQKKSGVLIVSSAQVSVKAAFSDGSLIWAETIDPNGQRDALVSLMLGARVIDKGKAAKIGELSRNTLKSPGRIAVDEGAADPAVVKRLSALRNTNAISILFSLTAGEYEFIPGDVPVDSDLDSPKEPDSVILDAMRAIDEWPTVRSRIRFYNTRWRPRKDAPRYKDAADVMKFGEGENVVWMRLNEHPGSDVRQLIDTLMLGEFETCRVLYSLTEAGMIEPIYPKTGLPIGSFSGVLEAARERPTARIALWLMLSITCISLAMFMVLASLNLRSKQALGGSTNAIETWAVKESLSNAERRRLSLAIESWRLSKGNYPASLEVLVENGRLSERDLQYPWKLPYVYWVESGSFVLQDPPY